MIEGQNIKLRVWRKDDLTFLAMLRNDIKLQAQLLARARGSTEEQVRMWLDGRADRFFFIIANVTDDIGIGYIQVTDVDTLNQHGELGICLSPESRGLGYGGEAINLTCDYLINTWRLRKLSLRVLADNKAALRCYEKIDFKRCGVLRQHVFFEGSWRDIVLMERLLGEES